MRWNASAEVDHRFTTATGSADLHFIQCGGFPHRLFLVFVEPVRGGTDRLAGYPR